MKDGLMSELWWVKGHRIPNQHHVMILKIFYTGINAQNLYIYWQVQYICIDLAEINQKHVKLVNSCVTLLFFVNTAHMTCKCLLLIPFPSGNYSMQDFLSFLRYVGFLRCSHFPCIIILTHKCPGEILKNQDLLQRSLQETAYQF